LEYKFLGEYTTNISISKSSCRGYISTEANRGDRKKYPEERERERMRRQRHSSPQTSRTSHFILDFEIERERERESDE
jgi:hypothetical protein